MARYPSGALAPWAARSLKNASGGWLGDERVQRSVTCVQLRQVHLCTAGMQRRPPAPGTWPVSVEQLLTFETPCLPNAGRCTECKVGTRFDANYRVRLDGAEGGLSSLQA